MTDVKEISLVKEWLVDVLPYEVFWANEDGSLAYGNQKLCERLGYKSSELTKLTIFDINTTVTPESWKKHWDGLKKNKSENFKAIHKKKSGKFYEVEVFAQFFSNNRKEMICGIMNDISSSSFYKNLINNVESIAKVGGWKLNLQDGSIIVTEEAFKIFGTENKEDFHPSKIIQFIKDEERFRSSIVKTIRNGIPMDEIFETKENPSRYIRSIAKPVLKGDKIFEVVGVYQDVTEQYLKETKLNFFKDVIDNAQDLVYIYNREGKLIDYSNSVADTLGYSRKKLDSATIFELDTGVTEDWWESHFAEIKEKGSVQMEWILTKKDGTRFPVDIVANYMNYQGQDINCAVVRDITKRKERDLKLYQALEEIKSLKNRLEDENEYLKEEISGKINANNIVCESEVYEKVLEQVNLVAPTDTTVLITGESGTGKELLASALHNNSLRKDRPLIKVNCATLPKELFESELFGHKKGAFTGAVADKVGKFTLADGGTIFLDEIGEMPIDLQPKLLRVLQEGEFDEVGGSKTIKVDVRVIAATNRRLEDMIKEGTFREDLYYRLNVFPIYNIPLRGRKEDIPLLAKFFLEKYSAKAGKAFKRLSKKTIDSLMRYDFPGNIRELENLIERAVILESGTTLHTGSWMPSTSKTIDTSNLLTFEEVQKQHIIKILERTNGKVSGKNGAAGILDMNAKTLFAKMKKLGIEKETIFKT
ncbi:Fis family transcriptional regulator [Croceitalea dokdonensis DOKDO 023]|uniref:Fis family transcriptional regulator n=1 Tax=Croceitalea dokdonensis DOKDO 023 TaxID=1300341 RepID=A0A0P7ARV5_9FLAO|nr:sigma 54-interacting transcriptional regulator [Croceitalea dokdonensis]KPM31231.1 Fis family transcriptional regulator [Croceitalea dokdonensis DOKDO 023]